MTAYSGALTVPSLARMRLMLGSAGGRSDSMPPARWTRPGVGPSAPSTPPPSPRLRMPPRTRPSRRPTPKPPTPPKPPSCLVDGQTQPAGASPRYEAGP
eukprot:6965171-Prymnesium_polylepis.1